MSDLKSWNVITLDGLPEGITLPELPTFDLTDGDEWGVFVLQDQETEPAGANFSGWGSATPFAVGEWAIEYTAAHPDVTVTWYEEFRFDEVGESVSVYRNGARVEDESATSQLVPDNLGALLAAAKAALDAFDSPDPARSTTAHYADHAPAVAAALRDLVKGLS